ncbi:MAG: hypothetical protein ACU0DW_05925 [Shimia sp.]
MSTPAVVQSWLNRLSAVFEDDDFDGWAAAVSLPFTMVTRTGETTHYQSLRHLRQDFEEYVSLVGLYMVTEIKRTVISVDQVSPLHIIARYESRMWRGTQPVNEGYTSTAMLHFDGGQWRASSILGAIGHRPWGEPIPDEYSNVVPFRVANRP